MPLPASGNVSSDPASGPPQRERRLDARRNLESIIDAARRTFAADPSASMQQVAEAAGLHRATVHRHFASRDDLLGALRHRAFDESLAALNEARLDEGSAPEALRRATVAFVELGERWKLNRYAPSLEHTPVTDEMGQLMNALFERGQREGSVRTDVQPPMLSAMWAGMVSIAAPLVVEGSSSGEVADVIVRTLLGPDSPVG